MTPPLPVVHSVQRWLPLTQSWLWDQVRFLPDAVSSTVVAGSIRNRTEFPWPSIDAPREPGPIRRRLEAKQAPQRRRTDLLRRRLQATGAGGVLHSHFGDQAWRDHAIARDAGVPQVVTFYGHDASRLPQQARWRERYAELFGAATRVLAEGPFMAATLRGLGAPHVSVHPLGVDIAGLDATRRDAANPGTLADGSGPLRVLMAGGFREKKGLPDGIAAAAACGRDVQVTIIGDQDGTPASAAEAQRIQAAIHANALRPFTRLLGFRPHRDLVREIVTSDVVLAPSRRASDGDCEGGAPVVLLEAMALGTPVISTRHCDIPFVLDDGANGLLADAGDIGTLASHLAAVADEPEAAKARAATAQADMRERFDARRRATALAGVYQEVAA